MSEEVGAAVVAATAGAALDHGAGLGKVVVGTSGGDSGDADSIISPILGIPRRPGRISAHGMHMVRRCVQLR
jgi:hypothetical protein